MKDNSKKILLWLYPIKNQNGNNIVPRLVKIEQLKIILPDLKQTSLRSLINLLLNKQYINQLITDDCKQVSITNTGMKALEEEIPALNDFSLTNHWRVINFLEPPKNDLAFRYLRRFLLNRKAIAINRGVYLFAQDLDIQTQNLLNSFYLGNVIVFKTDTFYYADIIQIIGHKTSLSDTISLLSGISKEINQLLIKIDQQKRLNDHQKKQINSLFCRLLNLLETDSSLLRKIYPQVKNAQDYLSMLQKIEII